MYIIKSKHPDGRSIYVEGIYEKDDVINSICRFVFEKRHAKRFNCSKTELMFIIEHLKSIKPEYTFTPVEVDQ